MKDIENVDYSYYLGKDYKQTQVLPKHMPTYIGNHPSAFDILVTIKHLHTAFASRGGVKKVPLFGLLVIALGCIFMKRSGSVEVRDKAVQLIGER